LASSEEPPDLTRFALSAISSNRFKSVTKTAQDLISNASAVWIELRICSSSGSEVFMRRTPDRYHNGVRRGLRPLQGQKQIPVFQ